MAVLGSTVTTLSASSNILSQTTNVSRQVASGIAGITAVSDLGSAIRSGSIASGAEAIGDLSSAFASFGGDANSNDWRVRLSLPTWPSFRSSPVLAPLKDAGGLIFPYTPQINIQSSASYNAIETVHTNYKFHAFRNSDPGTITVTAPMNVEDPTQGLYWIAAVHYLRSLTKMFTGLDPKAGNPPPIVKLNGYGNFVFKNVPVVITQFSTTLPNDCDYIAVPVVGSAAGAIEGIADELGGAADSLGGAGIGLGGLVNSVSSIAGGIGQIAGLAGSLGLGGKTSGGISYVPTKSSFQITLQPIYSRTSSRTFSLDRFVQGGYLNSAFGYI
jgi:hypothetical protein